MTGILRTGLAACIMTIVGGTLQADVLHLADGSRIVGTLEVLDDAKATLSGTFAGRLDVPRRAIVDIETDASVVVEVERGDYVTGRLASTDADEVSVHVNGRETLLLDLAELGGVYREDPLLRRRAGLQLSANTNVGVTLTNGNSETENLHLDGQIVARSDRRRYTASGEYTQEESRDLLVKRNWASLLKYDYFVGDDWFWFNSLTLESDEFADLELRTALAAGFGYQFRETDYSSLSLEIGPSYVHENFAVAGNRSYVGSRWALRYDQKLWWNLTYFLYNDGVIGFQDTSDLTTRLRTGLRADVTDRIIARVQTAINWDQAPPEGAEATDFEHTLTVGYKF